TQDLSPVKIVKNPDGSLQQAALMQNALSKARREIKQKHKELSKTQSSTIVTLASSTPRNTTNQSTSTINVHTQTKNDKNNRLTKFLKSVDKDVHNQNDSVKTIGEEILLYGSLCRKNPTIDGITFWKAHGEQLPLLKGMAAVYLSTPATSVPSESAFSLSAYVGRKERARLSPENLSYSVFLKDKLLSSFE
ncbi:unnamed protein product, partial [Rotaria magnacalcarata]